MDSIRERKKRRTRSEILTAAAHLFAERGLHGTTMEDIAAEAEVSVGTLYNYFGSKTALLVGLFDEEAAAMEEAGRRVVASPGEDAASAVKRLFDVYIGFLEDLDRELLAEAIAAGIRAGAELSDALFRLDLRLIEQVAVLLHHFRDSGSLSAEVSDDEGAMLLYSVFIAQLLVRLSLDDASLPGLHMTIHDQLDVAFAGLRTRSVQQQHDLR